MGKAAGVAAGDISVSVSLRPTGVFVGIFVVVEVSLVMIVHAGQLLQKSHSHIDARAASRGPGKLSSRHEALHALSTCCEFPVELAAVCMVEAACVVMESLTGMFVTVEVPLVSIAQVGHPLQKSHSHMDALAISRGPGKFSTRQERLQT